MNLVVSTVLEAENLLPLLEESQASGRKVNVGIFFFLSSFLLFSATSS
jgi:hypothetical protein